MKTVRRLFNGDIVSAVAFVAAAFASLFFFIDFVDELRSTDARGFTVGGAALYSLLQLPAHLYELAPIAVLIGTIYALARLAQTSQYTILRTSGLGPGRALWLLASLGMAFGVLTFVIGDYVAPPSERLASDFRASRTGRMGLGGSGAWLKEHADTAEGARSYSINVRQAEGGSRLRDVRVFEFDADGRLLRRYAAARASVGRDGVWVLEDVAVTRWEDAAERGRVHAEKVAELRWASTLRPDVVAAAVLPVSTMSTLDLYHYIGHLSANEQAAQAHQIQFWRRALYPFACLVMMGLALPFAYLRVRAGGVSLKVFGGIMLGISFILVNNVFRHLGMLGNWEPWVVGVTPGLAYLTLSMLAFWFLVRYR
ncbi:LPS export ABC transporter permease LptG [Piscinibacter koreensis]|uniref:LPS export ABC transporter permease LptG n=1 Tax=Piscinibacter koreensis TaxID=2742824 RepID=A0A7Y6NS03_9BURK|nr:LPS export ABC transporter permease LptG [Schlegelella koreensis]